jgi:uncharacterized LabA/DUF88 family protein
MKKVAVYIDGFNLYHAIDVLDKPWLKWLNLKMLSESFLRENEVLVDTNYFSAFATWLPVSYAKHREYVKALKHVGVNTCMGKFKLKPAKCKKCGAEWMKPEEKETDVNIAIKIVEDAVAGNIDRIILITADSDLKPAIDSAKRLNPECELFVVAPPKRYGSARELEPKLEITQGRLAKCLFPPEILDVDGNSIVKCPNSYKLPDA